MPIPSGEKFGLLRSSRQANVEFQMALQRQEFIRRLKAARSRQGLTQETAAHEVGVAVKTFANWESPKGSWPRSRQYDKLAEVLGVPRDHLLGPAEHAEDFGQSEMIRLLRQHDAMLRALLAHHGITIETLASPGAELESAVTQLDTTDKRKPARRKAGRSV